LFTGLIEEIGEVVSVARKDGAARLLLKATAVSSETKLGDSIAINGACLTVVEKKGTMLGFDLSDETLRSTNLGSLRKKDRVNVEPSLRVGSKIGGHFVTGHIDGAGRIQSKALTGEAYKFVIAADKRISDFLVEKGSVTVDGISLTVVDVLREGFSVVIIPHTAKMTTMGSKDRGDSVNIEVDILGKYVSKFLAKGRDADFMQTLSEEGFA
jgi:riboflavin synthase